MTQFIFVFPAIYFIVKKYKFNGLLMCGIINFMFELLKWAYGMNEACYRLLIFRYVLVIAFGCCLAFNNNDIKINISSNIMLCICGIGFIVLNKYIQYPPKIITYWTNTSFLACLYILPIATILFKKCTKGFKPVELIGRASYNIFLAQMVYYAFFSKYVFTYVSSRFLELVISIFICIIIGIIFYYIEAPITNHLTNKVLSLLDINKKVDYL